MSINNPALDYSELDFDQFNCYYYSNDHLTSSNSPLKNGINVFSLNVRSLCAHIDEIKIFLADLADHNSYFDILCFQETWLGHDDCDALINIDGYTIALQAKSCSTHGGIATYVRNDFSFEPILSVVNSPHWEGLFIRVDLNEHRHGHDGVSVVIGNVYRRPCDSVDSITAFTEDFFSRLNELCTANTSCIVAGDFNLNLLKINSASTVQVYLDSFLALGFYPAITLPTRLCDTTATLIDNIFFKGFSGHKFQNLISGISINKISDHQGCFVSIKWVESQAAKSRFKTITSRSPNFLNLVKQDLLSLNFMNNMNESRDVNENFNTFLGYLDEIITSHTVTKRVRVHKHKHKKSPWITFGIIKSIKFRDNLFKKMKQAALGSNEFNTLKTNLNTYNKILKRTIRSAKTLFYEQTFNSCRDDVKKTWKNINSILNRGKQDNNLPKALNFENRTLRDRSEILDALNLHFSTIGDKIASQSMGSGVVPFESFLLDSCPSTFNFNEVTVQEVESIICTLKSKHSCGVDGISTNFLKQIKTEISSPLTFLINQSLITGIFPKALKTAKVKPLFKKGARVDPNNYRPISLLSSLSKVFEKIILNQLTQYFESNSLLSHCQYGFRKKHSTEFAALELVDFLFHEMDGGNDPFCIFIDLSKAFDCLNHAILLEKFKHYGVAGNSHKLLSNYLCDRDQYTESDGVKSTVRGLSTGVPQGSILGPFMFLIYMNDFKNCSQKFHLINYADDTALCSTMNSFDSYSPAADIEAELAHVSNWLKANRLSLNVSKTKAMFFHPSQRVSRAVELHIENKSIENVSKFNYLGIVLDDNLKWGEHVSHIGKKISKAIGAMTRLKHFLPPRILKIIYNSLILCHFNYGILVWGTKTNYLFKLQKKAIRFLGGAGYNAHTEPLFRELTILKIDDLRKLQEIIFFFKFIHGLLPRYFQQNFISFRNNQNYSTRNYNDLALPRFRHEFVRQSLRYLIVDRINSCPECIKNKVFTHSLRGLREYAKRIYINRYVTICDRRRCYVCNRNQ